MAESKNKTSWEGLVEDHKIRNSAEAILPDYEEETPLAALAYERQEQNSFGLNDDSVASEFDVFKTLITQKKGFPEIDIEGNIFHILKQSLEMDEGGESGVLVLVLDAQINDREEVYWIYEIGIQKYQKIFQKRSMSPVFENIEQGPVEKSGEYKFLFKFSTIKLN